MLYFKDNLLSKFKIIFKTTEIIQRAVILHDIHSITNERG